MNEIELFFNNHHDFNTEEISFFEYCKKIFKQEEIELIKKAYVAAKDLHQGQMRDSGEPYITHPLRVAKILMNEIGLLDVNSICAAFLHDTIEDSGITKEFLSESFNSEIADLVDGVTKIKSIDWTSKDEKDLMNNAMMLRKVLSNPKILLIKLADRLHNMRTLEYKKSKPGKVNKQAYKSLETAKFFIPLARLIGFRLIKEELEDACFYFLDESAYKNVYSIKKDYIRAKEEQFEALKKQIILLLKNRGINASVEIKFINIYHLYLALLQTHKVRLISNFVTFQISVSSKEECYQALKIINEQMRPIKNLRDTIKEPEISGFRALSFDIEDFIPLHFEISTTRMKEINDHGYAKLYQMTTDRVTTSRIIKHTIFMKMLNEISTNFEQDKEFYNQVNKKIFVEHIKVYTPKKKIIWLPIGSTVIDFAYKIHSEVGKNAIGAIVNGIGVSLDFTLRDGDVVTVLTKTKTNKEQENKLKRER